MRWSITTIRPQPTAIHDCVYSPVTRPLRDVRLFVKCAHRIRGYKSRKTVSRIRLAFDLPEFEFPFAINTKQRQVVNRIMPDPDNLSSGWVVVDRFKLAVQRGLGSVRMYEYPFTLFNISMSQPDEGLRHAWLVTRPYRERS